MNTSFTTKELAMWIAGLQVSAEKDEQFLVDWFPSTKDSPVSIIGGWQGGNYPGVNADLFCTSKKNPDQIMCIKIIINKGPYAYADFECLDMPIDTSGEVDNTCLMLEWDDDPERVATFFWGEWLRMSEAYECGEY
jgi:hypothetical protein